MCGIFLCGGGGGRGIVLKCVCVWGGGVMLEERSLYM